MADDPRRVAVRFRKPSRRNAACFNSRSPAKTRRKGRSGERSATTPTNSKCSAWRARRFSTSPPRASRLPSTWSPCAPRSGARQRASCRSTAASTARCAAAPARGSRPAARPEIAEITVQTAFSDLRSCRCALLRYPIQDRDRVDAARPLTFDGPDDLIARLKPLQDGVTLSSTAARDLLAAGVGVVSDPVISQLAVGKDGLRRRRMARSGARS